MRARSRLFAVVLAAGTVPAATSCITPAHAPQSSSPDHRRLLTLERAFFGFVNTKLTSLDDVEAQTAVLEDLRLDYVDVVAAGSVVGDGVGTVVVDRDAERDRLLALLRLGELHLDLAARVRRVPYPSGADEAQKRRFDVQLSALALPLEATGMGMIEQLVQRAERSGIDGRFVARARLYQHLHAHKGDILLADSDVSALQLELLAQTFRAPRSLLEVGRLGQRAARR